MEPVKVEFAHIRDEVQKQTGKGGITLAFTDTNLPFPGDETQTNVTEYAVAACKDAENYSKRLGRNIAEGRLKKHRGNYVYTGKTKSETIQNIIDDLHNFFKVG
jgi:hypothetical protein